MFIYLATSLKISRNSVGIFFFGIWRYCGNFRTLRNFPFIFQNVYFSYAGLPWDVNIYLMGFCKVKIMENPVSGGSLINQYHYRTLNLDPQFQS